MPSENVRRVDFLPWEYDPGSDEGAAQSQRQGELIRNGGHFGDRVFIAPNAAVYCDQLTIGDRSYVAALAYLTGDLTFGADCSVNPFAVIRGEITMGDGVRIGAHTSILGFNHYMPIDAPVFTQGIFSKGITIGDDVWIGSNVTILDGVTIGDHVVIGAASVVTKDVPSWAIVAGNPARVVRDRRAETRATQAAALDQRLESFGSNAQDQAETLLSRAFDKDRFVDRPGLSTDVPQLAIRPWCDAIEVADMLLGTTPPGFDADDLIRRLTARQDPATGLIPDGDLSDTGLASLSSPDAELSPFDRTESYHILSVSHALHLLGGQLSHPIRAVHELTDQDVITALEDRDWGASAWASGAAVDTIATACAFNMTDFSAELGDDGAGPLFGLLGWLTGRANPETGMWGTPQEAPRWLESVNGFYRLTRGSYALFGLPLPYPNATIDTVLEHSADPYLSTDEGYTACNILDTIHPLWLASKQSMHRKDEGEAWARAQLDQALEHWVDGAGFAFAPRSTGTDGVPGLQGTEMWLSIVWLLADFLGQSDALRYRPRGVHNPDPLTRLAPVHASS